MRKAHQFTAMITTAVIGFGVASAAPAQATPCQDHKGGKKVACQKARDAVRWPSSPTARDLRVRGVAIQRFARLARCEAGPGTGRFGVRWHTPSGWRWQGGLGMYDRTHQSVGHPYGSDAGAMTWQEQMLVGQRVKERYGITAWSAHACF